MKNTLEKFYNSPNNIISKKNNQPIENRVKILPKKLTNKILKPHGIIKYFFRG
jgi:hypothetical protein